MTIKLPANVLSFCTNSSSTKVLLESYADYWNHYRSINDADGKARKFSYVTEKDGKILTLEDKEKGLNKMIIKEAERLSGISMGDMTIEQFASHPLVAWAITSVVSQMIDAVLPSTMVEGTSAYAEIKVVDIGQTASFDIQSRDLFPVTKVGRGAAMREAEMQKAFRHQAVLNPEGHEITVSVSLFRVLTGQDSLAEFTTKAVRSIETEMTRDMYTAFAAGFTDLSTDATTGLQVTGYTADDLTKLAAKVSSFSGGAKPIVMGTKVALSNVLPDDANYRYDLNSPYVTLGYVRTLRGVDTFEIPQIADWDSPFSTYISDESLWIIAPSTDKIVKCVIGGATISNVSGTFDSAMLFQNATFIKNWAVGVRTSSIGGLITL